MNWYELNLLETYLYVYNNHLATDTAWWNIIGFCHQTQLTVLGLIAAILPNANIKYTSIKRYAYIASCVYSFLSIEARRCLVNCFLKKKKCF